jgi:calcineurin-like phosphoesterase family protein
MRKIWLISDTHIGHENIIKYCNRPFANAAEMDEYILTMWNETVDDQDVVYHLGDVYFRDPSKLYQLKGRKRLLLGNHDDGKDPHLHKVFQKIGIWRKFPEYGLLLSHLPIHQDQLGGEYFSPTKERMIRALTHNVHGHIHDRNIKDPRYINVSVEQIGYKPIDIEEVAAKKQAVEKKLPGYAEFLAQDRAYQRSR